MATGNPWARAARHEKADVIARHLVAKLTPEQRTDPALPDLVARAPQDLRDALAAEARERRPEGERSPSEDTWALVTRKVAAMVDPGPSMVVQAS